MAEATLLTISLGQKVNKLLQNLLQHAVFRYLFVGGLAYIVDIGILVGLHNGLHTHRAVAAGASFWGGLLFSFLLQKLVAFQDYKKELKAISRQIAWYVVLIGFNYALTLIIVGLFPDKELILSRTVAVATTSLWNFFFYKHIIFRKATSDKSSK